jgi:hypothetical protein
MEQCNTIRAFVKLCVSEGETDPNRIWHNARDIFPYSICAYSYVQRLVREFSLSPSPRETT